MFMSHRDEKNEEHLPRLLQVEKGTFTLEWYLAPQEVYMGKEADKLIRRGRMAERMKAGERWELKRRG